MNRSLIALDHRVSPKIDNLNTNSPKMWVGVLTLPFVVSMIVLGPIFFPLFSHAQTKGANFWPQRLDTDQPPTFNCRIVRTYPHDADAFTQGLVISEGFFFESTGLHGFSSVRQVEPITGKVIKIKSLPKRYFGEGLTRLNDRLIQLTWKAGEVFSYDIHSFKTLQSFSWHREGWGITTNGKHLIISDGTHHLYFLDPDTFTVSRTLTVETIHGPVTRLNELEWVEGMVLANVWQKDTIVVISPKTGRVAAWISLDGLVPTPPRGVPNGIAYDQKNRRLYLTGKRWPHIFEVALIQ